MTTLNPKVGLHELCSRWTRVIYTAGLVV